MYSVEAQTAPRRKARRADEATATAISPRPPEARGACEFQEERGHVLIPATGRQRQQESSTAIATHLRRLAGNTWTQALLARDELDGWPDLRP